MFLRLPSFLRPSTLDAIDSFTSSSGGENADAPICSVCLSDVHFLQSHILRCGHRLHPECMGNCILSELAACPECRQPFSPYERIVYRRCGTVVVSPSPPRPPPLRRPRSTSSSASTASRSSASRSRQPVSVFGTLPIQAGEISLSSLLISLHAR